VKIDYVHGYDRRANVRLQDQADALVDLLHSDTAYSDGATVLEAGCGVGAQTVTLARRSPGARIVSVDIAAESLAAAKAKVEAAGLGNVRFQQADIFALPLRACIFRPCVYLLRARAPVPAARGARAAESSAEARWNDDRH
jgi:ubiquinone/menaquinone biosynthesis C-methylase UbiE